MIKPKVSIIIPAYNHEKFVAAAVESALDQSYKPDEIIIIDDGSKDNTGKICKKLSCKYKIIKYMSHDNIGAHNTINQGVSISSGDYVTILNSDDLFTENKIMHCIEIVTNNKDIELVSGKVNFIDRSGRLLTKGISEKWLERSFKFYNRTKLLPLSILNENFIATTSNMFFTKNIWKKVGGFQNLRYCHDLDFLMSCYRTGQFHFDSDNIHVHYRVHDSNTIKEDLSKIKVEIAAVIATSLLYDTLNFNFKEEEQIHNFFEFLRNKDMSDLIIVLMNILNDFNNRCEFYEYLSNDVVKSIYSEAIQRREKCLNF